MKDLLIDTTLKTLISGQVGVLSVVFIGVMLSLAKII